MSKKALFLLLTASLILAAQSHAAEKVTCESLKDEIAAKIEHNGVKHYRLEVLDADARSDGQKVGWCAYGKKNIYFWRETGAMTATTAPAVAANARAK